MNHLCLFVNWSFYILRPHQNGRKFGDNILKCIFVNENVWISIRISLNFVPRDQIDDIPVLTQIMDWRRPGDKPLPKPMMVRLLTYICVTRPRWVNVSIWPLPQGEKKRWTPKAEAILPILSCTRLVSLGSGAWITDNMMTSSNGHIFLVTGPLCEEFTDHRWIPLTKANNAELLCFLWSAPTAEQTMETPVIWDVIVLIMTSP